MNRKWLPLILMSIVAVFVLAACGGSQEEAASQEAAPAQSNQEAVSDTSSKEAAPAAGPVTIKLARFFGDCDDSTAGVTDVSKATTECEVIQILTNKFNAENEDGITVERLGGAEWGTYYDALNTAFAGGEPPDVAVMHGSNLPDYASRDLLRPLGDDFKASGVDPSDWTAPARGAVTYDGKLYGVPFDLHANLWHVNVDLFKEAGLVDNNGNPILPTSRDEFFEQAKIMKEKTGKDYFATDASQFPIGVRILFTLVWQQGSDLIAPDGTAGTVDTPEAAEALDFMLEMFKQGYANPEYDYAASQSAFLNGDVAVLHNGTWAVDQYNREAKFEYRAMDFPTLYGTPAVWANSHMWVIPKQADESKYVAANKFLKFLYDHVGDWSAGTGHLAPRKSVLASEQLANVPQRENYAQTANIARLVPAIVNWQAVEDILKEEIESTWLTGKDPAQALNDAEQRINDQLAGNAPIEPAAEEEAAEDSGAMMDDYPDLDIEPTTIKLARFFGDCDDSTAGVTDVSQATTECEVIQILTNKFNAENPYGITVERLGGAEWGTYYDALNTAFAGGEPPDVAVMHGSNLPDYAIRGLLLPLDDRYAVAGIDPSDWTDPAQGAVTYDGQMYAVAFDLHANLFHVNVDLFKQAGLVDDSGTPILPTSRDEFFEQAKIMKEKTGKDYFATDASQFPIGVRILFTMVWQQGSDLIAPDGTAGTVDTPEAAEALDFLNTMFAEGYANPEYDYAASQSAFLNGDAAILHNGTWAVDQYNREAKFEYRAMDFPTLYSTPAVWANSHMWVIPRQADESKYAADMAFLKFLYNHVGDWSAGTGHLAPRKSVLASEQLANVPQRENYAETASIARLVPAIVNWQAVEDILKEEVESTWLTGKDPAQALNDAEARINDQLAQ